MGAWTGPFPCPLNPCRNSGARLAVACEKASLSVNLLRRHRDLCNGRSDRYSLGMSWVKHDSACLCANPEAPMPLSIVQEYCLDYTKDSSTAYCLSLQGASEPLGIKAMKRRQLTLPACHPSRVPRSGESLSERVFDHLCRGLNRWKHYSSGFLIRGRAVRRGYLGNLPPQHAHQGHAQSIPPWMARSFYIDGLEFAKRCFVEAFGILTDKVLV